MATKPKSKGPRTPQAPRSSNRISPASERISHAWISPKLATIVALSSAALSCLLPVLPNLAAMFRSGSAHASVFDFYYGPFYASLAFSVLWLLASAYAMLKFGERGKVTLLGLLPAAFWPCIGMLILHS